MRSAPPKSASSTQSCDTRLTRGHYAKENEIGSDALDERRRNAASTNGVNLRIGTRITYAYAAEARPMIRATTDLLPNISLLLLYWPVFCQPVFAPFNACGIPICQINEL